MKGVLISNDLLDNLASNWSKAYKVIFVDVCSCPFLINRCHHWASPLICETFRVIEEFEESSKRLGVYWHEKPHQIKVKAIWAHWFMWIECGYNGGHEINIGRCWLPHVRLMREIRDRKNIGVVDRSKVIDDVLCRLHGGISANAIFLDDTRYYFFALGMRPYVGDEPLFVTFHVSSQAVSRCALRRFWKNMLNFWLGLRRSTFWTAVGDWDALHTFCLNRTGLVVILLRM